MKQPLIKSIKEKEDLVGKTRSALNVKDTKIFSDKSINSIYFSVTLGMKMMIVKLLVLILSLRILMARLLYLLMTKRNYCFFKKSSIRRVFWIQSIMWDVAFDENSWKNGAVPYFHKTLRLRCLKETWISFWKDGKDIFENIFCFYHMNFLWFIIFFYGAKFCLNQSRK